MVGTEGVGHSGSNPVPWTSGGAVRLPSDSVKHEKYSSSISADAVRKNSSKEEHCNTNDSPQFREMSLDPSATTYQCYDLGQTTVSSCGNRESPQAKVVVKLHLHTGGT